jgi:hypothetical protein
MEGRDQASAYEARTRVNSRPFTDQTLENAPVEATELRGAIAAVREIRAIVQEAGMGQTQYRGGLVPRAFAICGLVRRAPGRGARGTTSRFYTDFRARLTATSA